MKLKNAIVYCADSNREYLTKTVHSISSFKANNADIDTDIYLLVPESFMLDNEILTIFNDIKIVKVENNIFQHDALFHKKDERNLPVATHYRALIFNCRYFDNYDNILYIDGDTEIVKPIKQLLYTDLQDDKCVGVAYEWSTVHNSGKYTHYYIPKFYKEITNSVGNILNVDQSQLDSYFNSGVILLKQCKMKQLIGEFGMNELFEYYKQLTCIKMAYPDQNVLNYIFSSSKYRKYITQIDTIYNNNQYTQEYQTAKNDDVVVQHYLRNAYYDYVDTYDTADKKIQKFAYHEAKNQKNAIIYITDFRDFDYMALSIKTVRYFHKDIDIYVLSYEPSQENIDMCKAICTKCIDIKSIFDKLFPVYDKFKINYQVRSDIIQSQKYPKTTCARFALAYVNELNGYDKILYLDNDTIICKQLWPVFASSQKKYMSIVFDGECIQSKHHTTVKMFNSLKKYNMFKKLSNYFCSGVLLFDNKQLDTKELDDFIKKINILQTRIYLDKHVFFGDQEMLNLLGGKNNIIDKRLCASRQYSNGYGLSKTTCIYHYYDIKYDTQSDGTSKQIPISKLIQNLTSILQNAQIQTNQLI